MIVLHQGNQFVRHERENVQVLLMRIRQYRRIHTATAQDRFKICVREFKDLNVNTRKFPAKRPK
jgi:hypothetical protein